MSQKAFTILMVDDSADAREILEGILAPHLPGSTFLKARDGQEALKIIRTTPLDLVFIDEVMPKKSGTDVVREAWASGINCPFVILTGLRANDINVGKKEGHRALVVEKPVDLSELRQVLQNALNITLPDIAA